MRVSIAVTLFALTAVAAAVGEARTPLRVIQRLETDVYQRVQWIDQEENGKPATYADGSPRVPGPLSVVGPKLNPPLTLSPQEMKRINEATGELHCGDQFRGNRLVVEAPNFASSSAELIEDGTVALASWHGVFNSTTGKARRVCQIVGKAGIASVLIDVRPEAIRVLKAPNLNPGEAAVVVRLLQRRQDAQGNYIRGLPMRRDGSKIQYNEKRIMVTSAMRNRDNATYVQTPKGEPVIQECAPQLDADAQYGTLSRTKGNCTSMPESSGSLFHGREESKIVIDGIMQRGAKNNTHGKFDEASGRETVGWSFGLAQVEEVLEFTEMVRK